MYNVEIGDQLVQVPRNEGAQNSRRNAGTRK